MASSDRNSQTTATAIAPVGAEMNTAHVVKEMLWPTPVMFTQFAGSDIDQHNRTLEALVISGCQAQEGSMHELRLHELHANQSSSVEWLLRVIKEACAHYCGFASNEDMEVGLRGVVLKKFDHINTHTEARESDLGIAYWPSGDPSQIGQPINQNADGFHAPVFTLEDPSRHLSELRLPMEMRHSVDVCPRPGLLAIYPAHLPHNVHPYRGENPFVHIVAQVRLPWPKDYFRGNL